MTWPVTSWSCSLTWEVPGAALSLQAAPLAWNAPSWLSLGQLPQQLQVSTPRPPLSKTFLSTLMGLPEGWSLHPEIGLGLTLVRAPLLGWELPRLRATVTIFVAPQVHGQRSLCSLVGEKKKKALIVNNRVRGKNPFILKGTSYNLGPELGRLEDQNFKL